MFCFLILLVKFNAELVEVSWFYTDKRSIGFFWNVDNVAWIISPNKLVLSSYHNICTYKINFNASAFCIPLAWKRIIVYIERHFEIEGQLLGIRDI